MRALLKFKQKSSLLLVEFQTKAIPFFFRLLSNAFSDFGSVAQKRKQKNIAKDQELGGPVSQHNTRGT